MWLTFHKSMHSCLIPIFGQQIYFLQMYVVYSTEHPTLSQMWGGGLPLVVFCSSYKTVLTIAMKLMTL